MPPVSNQLGRAFLKLLEKVVTLAAGAELKSFHLKPPVIFRVTLTSLPKIKPHERSALDLNSPDAPANRPGNKPSRRRSLSPTMKKFPMLRPSAHTANIPINLS
ncbi:MAG: hypothetical protein H7245_14425 [Candidatus Saccharibacteria bacterium]|nr:hypothetical protein [Pseudorhodobacter sp.]